MYYQLNTMSVMISFSVSWLERGKSFEKSIKKKTFLQFPRKDSHKKTSVYVLRRRLMKFIWFSVCEKVITLNNKFWVWEKKAVNVKAASQYSKPTVLGQYFEVYPLSHFKSCTQTVLVSFLDNEENTRWLKTCNIESHRKNNVYAKAKILKLGYTETVSQNRNRSTEKRTD